MACHQKRLGLQCYSVGHEPAAGAKRAGNGIQYVRACTPTDEHRIRPWQSRERLLRRAFNNLKSGHAKRRGIAADARRTGGVCFDGHRAERRIGQQPFDRDRTSAGFPAVCVDGL